MTDRHRQDIRVVVPAPPARGSPEDGACGDESADAALKQFYRDAQSEPLPREIAALLASLAKQEPKGS
ncbi:hypothetical protein J4558_14260 [Leptolyngbya sp. 15MV]|jgi:hypothetical protein|nr:hypothetical protein J4558_14260 [Leptolyngbya sp. 15MV]